MTPDQSARMAEIAERVGRFETIGWKWYGGNRGIYDSDGLYVCSLEGRKTKKAFDRQKKNLDFILASRTDIPYLLSSLESTTARLREVEGALREAIATLDEAANCLEPTFPSLAENVIRSCATRARAALQALTHDPQT